ncbi:glutathione-disulfide reductase [Prochlorococcus marinus str. MU1404]|uniref:glutathione-disulfide reductase n=1 Tax=Prochlorococcus marinus TaxID=1219 RepID=UPI001ADAE6DD|nr:glutathione-disulfide reductase [Prochlorococcus marinus]MBO8229770.1 glutathione-disulfide reductase [Prochlorococcus marinus XMU1404]MBW3072848.1 glutathione-disulfide reductase [Prochlorococcus marinus str. MU1404]MCR8545894.1 glutathione-disulfide reductase [Prochlorococcus marinus CUG1432]
MEFEFDLIVVGAGSGGLAAAKRAASYGAKVAIIEVNKIGGTCVIRGCVPKKLMVYAAKSKKNIDSSEGYGLKSEGINFESKVLLKNIREEVARLSNLHRNSLNKLNITIFEGLGRFVTQNELEIICPKTRNIIDKISSKKILISVGGKPKKLNIPGIDLAWTSDDIFELEKFPKSILIVGGGYIACEFASIFRNLGTEVTQLIRGQRLLNGFDEDLSSCLEESPTFTGINIISNNQLISIKRVNGDLQSSLDSGDKIFTNNILIATGREPNLLPLNLDFLNLKMDGQFLDVDELNQTSNANIYAVGDIINRPNLTPVAIEQGRVFSDNFFNDQKRKVNYENIPKAVFTIPEISTVGLSEERAKHVYSEENIKVFKCKFTPMSNTFKENKSKCMLKIVVNKLTDKVLGCHMFGETSSEIIQMVSIALNAGITKKDFDITMALHPTISEEFVTMYR